MKSSDANIMFEHWYFLRMSKICFLIAWSWEYCTKEQFPSQKKILASVDHLSHHYFSSLISICPRVLHDAPALWHHHSSSQWSLYAVLLLDTLTITPKRSILDFRKDVLNRFLKHLSVVQIAGSFLFVAFVYLPENLYISHLWALTYNSCFTIKGYCTKNPQEI